MSMTVTDRDEILIERLSGGDERAFEALRERHASCVESYLRRRATTEDDAEEIAQSVWYCIWRGAAGFSPPRQHGSAQPWIFTIVRNCLSDFYRRDGRRPDRRSVEINGVSPALSTRDDHFKLLLRDELAVHLSAIEATVVEGVVDGRSYRSIRQGLGVLATEGALRTLKKRAVETLRARIALS